MNSINKCFQTSKNIINTYNILEHIATNLGIDSKEFKDMVNRIKNLVIREYQMYNSMNIYDILNAIKEFDEPNIEFNSYTYRLNTKLCSVIELSESQSFTYDDLIPNIIKMPSNIKFSASEIICTILDLNILRNMNKKVNNILNSQVYSDDYKEEFRELFLNYLIYYFTVRNSSEFIALNYNFDINKCPQIKYIDFINNLHYKYGVDITSSKREFENGFLEMAMSTLKTLTSLEDLDDGIDKDYQYMFYLTAFNVYVNDLDYDKIMILSDCLNSIHIYDIKLKENIRKILVRKKEEN